MNRKQLQKLQVRRGYPSLSLIAPTHRTSPDNLQDPIHVKNLVTQATNRLQHDIVKREDAPLLECLNTLVAETPWHHTLDGLAFFVSKDYAARFDLPFPVVERVQVEESFATRDQAFAVTYAPQLIAIIVAAIGIFDTLIALLLERGRELATLRALGASAAQIRKMTYIEFALIGVFAWIIGTFVGLCLAWQLINATNRQFFGWSIAWQFSPQTVVIALVLSVVAAVGAGFWPSFAASKRVIADALQVE